MMFKKNETIGILLTIFCLFGALMIWSASFFLSYSLYKNGLHFFLKQLVGYGIFFAIIGICYFFVSQKFLQKYVAVICVLFLILSLISHYTPLGVSVNGAKRWIRFFGIVLQLSEIIKPLYLLTIVQIMVRYSFQINQLIFYGGCFCAITCIVLLLQPDFGHAVLIALTTILLFFFVGNNKKKIGMILLGCGVIGGILLVKKPYRMRRIIAYLDPWKDPRGSGFQIIQSLVAIKNGGICGVGLGNSKQKLLYLPLQHTDFIFAIICEELGMIGGIAVITLFFLLFLFLMVFAMKTPHQEARFYTVGLALLLFLQASLNVLVTTATLPTKGIGLPFISYGVSSLVGYGIAFGIFFVFQRGMRTIL